MKKLLILLISCSSTFGQVITDSLIIDLQAGVGITESGGYISAWADQSGNGHDAAQTDDNYKPQIYTDYDGLPAVQFDAYADLTGPPYSTNKLEITNMDGDMTTRSFSIYWIGTGAQCSQALDGWKPGNFSTPDLLFQQGVSLPQYVQGGGKNANIPAFLNRAIYVVVGSSSNVTLQCNHYRGTGTAISTATFTNCVIGGPSRFATANLNRMLVYATNHTWAQIDQNVSALASLYKVHTNYTKLIVCYGDSHTEGSGQTNLTAYPSQLARKYPEYAWVNAGKVGKYIGSNNVSASLFQEATNKIDPYITNSVIADIPDKYLMMFAGANDLIGGGQTPEVTWQRLTNFFDMRRQVGWTNIYTSTICAIGSAWANGSNYNILLRDNWQTWATKSADFGIGSPYETRLSDQTDSNYFWDQNHPGPTGYSVIVDHMGQLINGNRKVAGFW